MKIIKPLQERSSFFDGWETDKAVYNLVCVHCKADNLILFKEMLDAAWGWVEKTEPNERQLVANIFKINLENKSIRSGQHCVVAKKCHECGAQYYAFFWFNEYRNSCYDISLRGIAEKNTEQGA
jgi:hypothetical protein